MGLVLAGLVGALAIVVDFYSELSARFPPVIVKRVALATRPWQLFAFVLGWSLVCTGFAWFIFRNPAWAERAFQIAIGDNLTEAGFVIGCSAMLLIRSQLGKIGNFNLGFEYLYAETRDAVISAWHQHRVDSRTRLLAAERSFHLDHAGTPHYAASLTDCLRRRAEALPAAEKDLALSQIASVEAKGDLEATLSRKTLTGIAIDYFGPGQHAKWASDTERGNKDPNIP